MGQAERSGSQRRRGSRSARRVGGAVSAIALLFVGLPTAAADTSLCVGDHVVLMGDTLTKGSPTGDPHPIDLPAGTYDVRLVSAENDHPEGEQPDERWAAQLHSDGVLVATTSFTDDLPGSENAQIYTVAQDLELSVGVTAVVATLYPHGYSVDAVCAIFDEVGGDGPMSPQPEDDSAAVLEDGSVEIHVVANDSDADGDLDPSSVTAVAPAEGQVANNVPSAGWITYTPHPDENGVHEFSYEVCDLTDLCATAEVEVSVTPVNDAPSFTAGDPPAVTPNAGSQTVTGWANEISPGPDDESSQTVTFAVTAVGDADLFEALPQVDADGTLTYTPAGDTGTSTFTMVAQDDGGTANGGDATSPSQSFTITMGHHPVSGDDSAEVLEDTPVAIEVLVNDSDTDGDLDESSVDPGTATSGTTVAAGGVVTYTPVGDFFGADSFSYEVCDLTALCDTADVSITVTPVNDPPSFDADDPPAVEPDSGSHTLIEWATEISPGPDNESAQIVSFTVTAVGAPGLFSVPPAVDDDGTLSYTPAGDTGTSTFEVVAQDDGGTANGGDNRSPPQSFTITIDDDPLPPNRRPVARTDFVDAVPGVPIVIAPLRNDSDPDGHTIVLDDIIDDPAKGTARLLASNRIEYTPAANAAGPDSFTYRVCDTVTNRLCDTAVVVIDVVGPRGETDLEVDIGIVGGHRCEPVHFIVVVSNEGSATAEDAQMAVTLTDGAELKLGATPWSIDELEAGESMTAAFSVDAKDVDLVEVTAELVSATTADVDSFPNDGTGDDFATGRVELTGECTEPTNGFGAVVFVDENKNRKEDPGEVAPEGLDFSMLRIRVRPERDERAAQASQPTNAGATAFNSLQLQCPDDHQTFGRNGTFQLTCGTKDRFEIEFDVETAESLGYRLTSPLDAQQSVPSGGVARFPVVQIVQSTSERIEGSVVERLESGETEAAAGVTVLATLRGTATKHSASTDESGGYGIDLTAGTWEVSVLDRTVISPPSAAHLVVVGESQTITEVDFELQAPLAQKIEGTVSIQTEDGDQEPASRRLVTATARDGESRRFWTRDNGTYEIYVPPGTWDVTMDETVVEPEGGGWSVDLPAGDTASGIDFLLPLPTVPPPMTHRIEGTVWISDEEGNLQAVPGVMVTAELQGGDAQPPPEETNSSGEYRFDDIGPGTYLVQTGAENVVFPPGGMTLVTVTERDAIAGVDFIIRDGAPPPGLATIPGVVWIDTNGDGELADPQQCSRGGAPVSGDEQGVAGADVRLMQSGRLIATDSTNQDGCFQFDDVPSGTYEIEVSSIGSRRTLARGELVPVTIGPDDESSDLVRVAVNEIPVERKAFPWWILILILIGFGVAFWWATRPEPARVPYPLPGPVPHGPYPGPRPFDFSERHRFFGRDEEVRVLNAMTYANRLTVLYGPSGAGKTSLLHAGYTPRLDREDFELLPIVRFRADEVRHVLGPGNEFVAAALATWTDGHPPLLDTTFSEWFADHPHRSNEMGEPMARILIFDEFGEIFAPYPERWQQRHDFFEQLHDHLARDELDRVVISIDESHLGELEPLLDHLGLQTRTELRLDSLDHDESVAALLRPLQATEVAMADDVAEAMVAELRRLPLEATGEQAEHEFIDPLILQIAAVAAWRGRYGAGEITGRHSRTWTDTGHAVIDFYDEAVRHAAIGPDETGDEGEIRNWIEANLITSVGSRSGVRLTDPDVPPDIVSRLEEAGLVVRESSNGQAQFMLAHDRFVGPILVRNDEVRDQQLVELSTALLTRSAVVWVRNGRKDADLLTGADLAAALAMVRDHPEVVRGLQRAYLDASAAAAAAAVQ